MSLEESSLISPDIKAYNSTHKLEDSLNEVINEVLKDKPEDPYSQLTSFFIKKCKELFRIECIKFRKVLNSDLKTFLYMDIYMSYKGSTRKILSHSPTFNTSVVDTFKLNTPEGIELFIKAYKDYLETVVNGFSFSEIMDFDKVLLTNYDQLRLLEHQDAPLLKAVITNVSFSVLQSTFIFQDISPFHAIQESLNIKPEIYTPNLGFVVFKCGKSANSKVKFEKFMIFINTAHNPTKDEVTVSFSKLWSSTRKVLTSGKQGENGMRPNSSGSYSSPSDTINDTVKLLEDILKDTGEAAKFSIGIECNANNFFNETTKKYEMDGFKTPIEADQLIDFYLKYVTDHPAITYLEDILADSDHDGWRKVKAKFAAKPNVHICSKSLINDNLSNFRQFNEEKSIEDDMKEEEKAKLKEENSKLIGFKSIALRQNEFVNSLDLQTFASYFTKMNKSGGELNVSIYDALVESDQTFTVDIAFGIKAKNLILTSINLKNERLNKVNRFLEILDEMRR